MQLETKTIGQQTLKHVHERIIGVDRGIAFGLDVEASAIDPIGATDDLVRTNAIRSNDATFERDILCGKLSSPRTDAGAVPRGIFAEFDGGYVKVGGCDRL